MKNTRIHAVAGILAASLVASFLVLSVVVEIVGDHDVIALAKTIILIAVLVLVSSMAFTGATGRRLAARRGGPVIRRKKRRMIAIAAIGVVVLIPCAFVLRQLSAAGDFGPVFVVVQGIELVAGAVNASLLALNIRAGRLMAGHSSRASWRASRKRSRAASKSTMGAG
ncbi:hypothetical protein [Actinocrispum wychmicini]|uniref:Transmembrane protein n=1 Tax=Actinocrispum wychmicini TaxID=1213861 RepID=A0A4R2JQL6_9PSEU|nr:hypothetical protein [Actinocrispum wychmicini]TCO62521.1 hypothetical protein EV192_102660 [Actinocrispum wychmicini]